MNDHKTSSGHLEYAFHKEIFGLSKLFQYLLLDEVNRKYVFFPVRGAFESFLYLEYVLRLSKEDNSKILELLSRDITQIGAAINAAIRPKEEHQMHKILKSIGIVNKIFKTNFDSNKIKSNTKIFSSIN